MLKVIIIDDEPTIRKGLVNCINWKELDCAVTGIFTNGLEALESIKISPPDIILTDIRMPRLNGLELAQYLCENNYKCKVIILTAFPDFTYSQKAIQYGVVDFVIKPTSPRKLIESIKKAKNIIDRERINVTNTNLKLVTNKNALENIEELILLNIVNGVYSSPSMIENKLSAYDIHTKSYFSILIHANMLCHSGIDDEITHIYAYIQQVFIHQPYYKIFIDQSHIMMILSVDEHSSDATTLQSAVVLCEELLSMIHAFLDLDINIAISSRYASLNKLPIAYKETKNALQNKFYLPSESIFISYKNTAYTIIPWENQLYKIIAEITKSIESVEYTDIPKYIEKFFDTLKCAMYPAQTARKYIFLLFTRLQPLSESVLDSHESIEKFMTTQEQMNASKNIDILYNLMISYINMLLEKLSSEISNQDLIEQVNSYIGQNFQEDLTLSGIANHFHLNSSYLSRFYKKETNENLIAALTKVRIDHAKKILLTTDKRIYEVALEVGIGDPTYFSQVFKRYTGLNPREYKEQKSSR